jgi:hypothetical protein
MKGVLQQEQPLFIQENIFIVMGVCSFAVAQDVAMIRKKALMNFMLSRHIG